MVCEERVEQMPVRVCRMVAEQQTVRVPRCVETRTPVTYTYRIPRTVMYKVPVVDPCDPCGGGMVAAPMVPALAPAPGMIESAPRAQGSTQGGQRTFENGSGPAAGSGSGENGSKKSPALNPSEPDPLLSPHPEDNPLNNLKSTSAPSSTGTARTKAKARPASNKQAAND